jgi:hypothetical protein
MPALSSQFQFILNSGTFTATSVQIPSAAVAPDGSSNFYSLPEKGDGYYGSADGLHTVTFTITPNFTGDLGVQATLSTAPQSGDWFAVNFANLNTSTISYNNLVTPAATTTNYVNFTGNFVWVRAVVKRSTTQPNGTVLSVNYNH